MRATEGRGYYVQDITISQRAVLALTAGLRDVTVPVPGLAVGAACQVLALNAPPIGYAFHNAWCATSGTLTVRIMAPLLALGASFSIPCKLIVYE